MTTREPRTVSPNVVPATRPEGDAAPESTSREDGDAFLEAADAAIDRALSGTPEAFLAQNRQLGGQ